MKKAILLISIIILAFLLSSCMLSTNNAGQNIAQIRPALGNIFMPKDFLEQWFSGVRTFNPSSQMVLPQLIASQNEIASTQQVLVSPVLSSLPSDYNSALLTFSKGGNIPNVGDQWYNNTCWAFATVESLESAMVVQLGSEIQSKYSFISDPSSPTFSTQFVSYNNANWNISGNNSLSYQETNEDEGGNLFFAFYDLVRRGDPLATDFPYYGYYLNSQGDEVAYPYILWDPANDSWPQDLVQPISTFVINPWQFSNYTTFINTIKSAIMKYGGLAVQLDVYSDFDTFQLNEPAGPNGWVYPGPSSTAYFEGGHAVLLVGWDDNWTYGGVDYGPVWILENSWGTSWGDNGFWRQPMITQTQFDNLSIVPNWQIEGNSMYVPYFGG
ncbi:C1 family peptidase [Athalassotoga sp.]|uniref:C1 family peptidase n=1 Tax=Athalassotoga sp. TaxID=2022597 RepID=UPI003D038D16